jgi:hypothetical protein
MDPSSGTVYAVAHDGTCTGFSRDGTQQPGTVQFPQGMTAVIPANLVRGGDSEFLCTGWQGGVTAVTATGVVLWTYPTSGGRDFIAAADLNGDGLDEAIIASAEGSALDALDSQGHPLWQASIGGGTTSVSAADLDGDGATEVMTVGAQSILVFEGKTGAQRPAIGPSNAYIELPVYSAPGSATATRLVVGAFGSSPFHPQPTIVGLSATGTMTWTLSDLEATPGFAGASAHTRPWVAVQAGADGVYVIDAERGVVLGSVGGIFPVSITWLERQGAAEPLLAVAGGGGLVVYRVTGSGAATTVSPGP